MTLTLAVACLVQCGLTCAAALEVRNLRTRLVREQARQFKTQQYRAHINSRLCDHCKQIVRNG